MLPPPPPPLSLSRTSAPTVLSSDRSPAPTLAEVQADVARLSSEGPPADEEAAAAHREALQEIAHKVGPPYSAPRARYAPPPGQQAAADAAA